MGGAIITVKGQTEKEVARELTKKRQEALNMGLYEEFRTTPIFDPESQQYRAIIKVHS